MDRHEGIVTGGAPFEPKREPLATATAVKRVLKNATQYNGILAQLVEHLTFNQVVGGSNPPCLSRNTVKSRVTGISNEYGTQKSTQSTQKTLNYQQKEKGEIL